MDTYFSSDMHFGHERILAFCDRPYGSVEEMNEGLVDLWNQTVAPQDFVWVLGDAVMGKRDETLKYISRLNGTKVLIPGNHDYCVSEDTRALTRSGFKSHEELVVGDEVLSCTDNGITKWEPIQKVISYQYTGPMVSYSGRGFDGLVTPDHRVVLRKTKQNSSPSVNWKEYLAEDLLGDFAKGYIQTSTDNENSELGISDDLIRLTAWCLTDGSYRNGSWCIYQRQSNADKIERIISNLSMKYSKSIRSRDPVSIMGKALKRRSEAEVSFYIHKISCGVLPEDKVLPGWTRDLSSRQFEVFWDTIVDGDGSYRSSQTEEDESNSGVVYCNLPSLRDDLRILLALNGYSSSVSVFNGSDFRLNFTKRSVRMLDKKIPVESIDYDGIVWCVTVESGRFFVERNGKVHLTGNCHPMHKKADAWAAKYIAAGFDDIAPTTVDLEGYGRDIKMSHFPNTLGVYDDRDFEKWAPQEFDVLIHGHVHNTWKVYGNQVNVGMDVWDLKPVHIDEVLSVV